MARQLHRGHGRYIGFAMDAFTNDFAPYPMDLTVSGQEAASTIRWKTLNDSVTKVEVTSLSRRSSTGLHTSMSFSEVELLRGENILVPNHYKGHILGPCVIGVFANGCFFLIREEAVNCIADGGGKERFDSFEGTPRFQGMATMELEWVDDGRYGTGKRVSVKKFSGWGLALDQAY